MIPVMRTGLLEGESPAMDDAAAQVHALMLAFSKEAVIVAGRCTCAEGRKVVKPVDMRDALMYCARTFFQRSDEDLQQRVEDATQDLEEDERREDEDDSEDEDEEEATASTEEDEEETIDPSIIEPQDVALRRNVKTVAAHWHLWAPTDPVHVLIKRAIDAVPCGA